MDYLVRFVCHIDLRKRPENFPKEVYSDMYVRTDNDKGLMDAINERSKVFVMQQFVVCPLIPGQIENGQIYEPDKRIMVPMHMITHISTITKRVIGDIPYLGEESTAQVDQKVFKN